MRGTLHIGDHTIGHVVIGQLPQSGIGVEPQVGARFESFAQIFVGEHGVRGLIGYYETVEPPFSTKRIGHQALMSAGPP